MEREELAKVASEINDLFGLDPAINTKAAGPVLTGKIYEALKLLQPGDKLKKESIVVIKGCEFAFDEDFFEDVDDRDELTLALQQLGIWVDHGDEITDAEEVALEQEVKDAEKLSELKEIAKTNDEFKSMRDALTKFRTTDKLREEMLKMLEEGPAETEPEETPEEKPKKKQERKAPTAGAKKKWQLIIDTIVKNPEMSDSEILKELQSSGIDVSIRSISIYMREVKYTLSKCG